MKQKVLIFASNPELDTKLIQELEKTGIECKIAGDLGAFHWILAVNIIDALIFNTQFFIDKCIAPLTVLERFKSHHTIIEYHPLCYLQKEKIKTYQLDPSKITKKHPANPDQDLDLINKALFKALSSVYPKSEKTKKSSNEEILEKLSTYNMLNMLFTQEIHTLLQKKQLQILNFIACCGETGCTNEEISTSIWGKSTTDKKKDIQSYISKINVKLVTRDCENFVIGHINKHYFLQKK